MIDGATAWSALSIEPEQIQTPDDDPEVLWNQYFRRQRLLSDIVRGEMHPDDLLDCMLEDNISPDDYLDDMEFALAGMV